jgi:hypothetical protein
MALQHGEAIPSISTFVIRLFKQAVELGLNLFGKALCDKTRLPYSVSGNR